MFCDLLCYVSSTYAMTIINNLEDLEGTVEMVHQRLSFLA